MSLSQNVTGLLGLLSSRGSVSPAIKNTPAEEAAQNYVGKASKMEMAHEAVMVQDLQALAQADRDKVARLEQATIFKGQPSPTRTKVDDMGNIIVCDDYVHPSPPASGIGSLGAIGIAAVTGLSVAGATWAMKEKPALQTPGPAIVATAPARLPEAAQLDSEWDQELYTPAGVDEAGNPVPEKIVGRVRYRSRFGVVEQRQPDGSWKTVTTVRPQ